MDRKELLAKAAPVREAYARHGLATHAAAIGFRILVVLPAVLMLGVSLLGLLGLEETWRDSIAPPIRDRLEPEVFRAIDFVVEEIMERRSLALLAFAAGLLLWEAARGVRAVTRALNEIHDVDERRPWQRLALVTVGLAAAVGACVLGAALVTIVGGRLGLAAQVLRWPVAVLLLGLAVALLVRYAPAERPAARWASLGSAAIVGGWIVLSLGFGIWVRDVASYKSAAGTLLAFLVLTTYVLALAAVFLVGVELDEEAREGDAH